MKCRKAYAIIPVGENDRSAHVAQQKAPEVATPGLSLCVLVVLYNSLRAIILTVETVGFPARNEL